jgi:hypothetical protein
MLDTRNQRIGIILILIVIVSLFCLVLSHRDSGVRYEGPYSVDQTHEKGLFEFTIFKNNTVRWSTLSATIGKCVGEGEIKADGHIHVAGKSLRGDTLDINGVLSGDTITGRYTCSARGIGPFSATKM